MRRVVCMAGWVILAVMVIRDHVMRRVRTTRCTVLPNAKLLQMVLDLSTRAFRGRGVSAAVITEQGHWAGASGTSAPGRPVRTDMLFNMGSIGKNFLAALTLQLAEEGKLHLDDPIAAWGLGSPTIDERITVRQLLNHTSGIFDWVTHPRSPFCTPYAAVDHARVWTQDEVLSQLSGAPYFAPGKGWHYSTTNYNLLRVIVEQTSGTSAAAEIRRRFLEPLGLEHTLAVDGVNPPPSQLEMAHSWCDIDGDGELEDISGDSQAWITSMSPAMMYASVLDLARWSQALYGGQVLNGRSLDQMLDFHRPTPDEPPLTGYGLGTAEIAVKGLLQAYGHLGYHYGSMSAMLCLPKIKTSVVVLTNEDNHPFQYSVAIGLVAAMMLRRVRYLLWSAFLLAVTLVLLRSKRRDK